MCEATFFGEVGAIGNVDEDSLADVMVEFNVLDLRMNLREDDVILKLRSVFSKFTS